MQCSQTIPWTFENAIYHNHVIASINDKNGPLRLADFIIHTKSLLNINTVPTRKEPEKEKTDKKPVFKQKLKDVVAAPGQEAKFDVVVTTDNVDIEWMKDDKLIEDKGRFILVDDEGPGMFSLVIDDVQPEDAGEYECVAINDNGETSTKASLNFEQNGITPDLIEEAQSAPITLDEVEGTSGLS